MAVKNILEVEIDVKDDKFKEFIDVFNNYSDKLKAAAENTESITKDFIEAFNGTLESLKEATGLVGKLSQAQEKSAKVASRKVKPALQDATKETKNLASEFDKLFNKIERAAPTLVKVLGSILGPLGGGMAIATGAAILAKLALNKAQAAAYELGSIAVNSQKGSRGLGVSAGELRSYETNYQRVGGADVIQRIAEAQFDPEKQVYLQMATGAKNIGEVQQANPIDLAQKLFMRAHDWWEETPAKYRNSATANATGLPQLGFSAAELRQWGNTPASELQAARAQYLNDIKGLSISDKSAGQFYDLKRAIDYQANRSDSRNIEKFDDLAESTSKLVETMVRANDALFNAFNSTGWERELPADKQYLRNNPLFGNKPDAHFSMWKPEPFKPTVFDPSQGVFSAGTAKAAVKVKSDVKIKVSNATGSNLFTAINGAAP